MRYVVVSAYYLLMTGWIYWVDAGHGDSWWTVAPMAVAQVGLGLVLGRWWVPVLPTALPLIAIPAGYPESQYSEPLPLWFGMAYAAALAIPLVLLGVVSRKIYGAWRKLSRGGRGSRSAPGIDLPAVSRR
jgi:cytochrome c biogenesis protein CcdA